MAAPTHSVIQVRCECLRLAIGMRRENEDLGHVLTRATLLERHVLASERRDRADVGNLARSDDSAS